MERSFPLISRGRSGSSRSRSASPSTLNESTVRVIASPANSAGSGDPKMSATPMRTMFPQEGAGGCAPRPMKLSVASSRIAVPTQIVVITISGPEMLGSTWRKIVPGSPRPIAIAAST